MSDLDGFIAKAAAFFAVRRHKAARRFEHGMPDSYSKGWRKLGSGHYGEAWAHEAHPGLVLKISGPAGWGGYYPGNKHYGGAPKLDGWPTYIRYCQQHPAPNLPKVLHFEQPGVGMAWAVLPKYEEGDDAPDDLSYRLRLQWRDWLNGDPGSPEWLWPIIGMRSGLQFNVDLHGGNVMWDAVNKELIMTDPFSSST